MGFSPLTSLLVVKVMQEVVGISADQHSLTRQIYTVRSCHTCGDPLSDRVVCPSRLCSLQIKPSRRRKVLSLIWPFSDSSALLTRRLSESSGGTNASLSAFTCTATSRAWPGCLLETVVFVKIIHRTGKNPPPEQQVATFPDSQPVVECFSRPDLIPLWIHLISNKVMK